MITSSYVRTMAAYNAEMNRRVYAAAGRLSEAERKADRGAFWGSVQGTLNHLLWGDLVWMARFAGWTRPPLALRDSAGLFEDFRELSEERARTDAGIQDWAATVDDVWLAQDLTWFSGAAERELRNNRGFLVAHLFNHQTHHRGQVHAMLTAYGQKTGDTDLMQIVPGPL